MFHETYPGNIHDTKEFHQLIDRIKGRLNKVGVQPSHITLVFDKGNNSLDNIDKIFGKEKKYLAFHVVGSLKFSEHKELLNVPKKDLTVVPEYQEDRVTAIVCKKEFTSREVRS